MDGGTKYLLIAAELRSAIRAGHHPVGSRLPTHLDLAREYGVSKETAAQAVRLLEAEGLVQSTRSRGTVVLEAGRRVLLRAPGSQDHRLEGSWAPLAPAAVGIEVSPDHLALVGPGAEVTVQQLGYPGCLRAEQVATRYRRPGGGAGLSWQETVSCRPPNQSEARMLGSGARTPLLCVVRVGRRGDEVVELVDSVLSGQRYEIRYLAVSHT